MKNIRKRKTILNKRLTAKSLTNISKIFTSSSNGPLSVEAELNLMQNEESAQTKVDRFWGIDKDLNDRIKENIDMGVEDEISKKCEREFAKIQLQKIWDQEFYMNQWNEKQNKIKTKNLLRDDYMKFLLNSNSSEEVIAQIWNLKKENIESEVQNNLRLNLTKDTFESSQQLESQSIDQSKLSNGNLSVHLDGLQQSKAIIDKASYTFKQTLRRINSHMEEESEAYQPFKSIPAAFLHSSFYDPLHQKKSLKLKHEFELQEKMKLAKKQTKKVDIQEVYSQTMHNGLIDGHPLYKWDQEVILQSVFSKIDKYNRGMLTLNDISVISYDSELFSLLKYTVFWSYIKLKKWSFFESLFNEENSISGKYEDMKDPSIIQLDSSSKKLTPIYSSSSRPRTRSSSSQLTSNNNKIELDPNEKYITCYDWINAAISISHQNDVPVRFIRTLEEHENLMSFEPNKSLRFPTGIERDFYISRSLKIGDSVWVRHHNGPLWLPAVIKSIHDHNLSSFQSQYSDSKDSFQINFGGSSCYFTYDVWFPLNQRDLQYSRAMSTSRQLISLPSQQELDQLPCKPFMDERNVCSYAFDLLDQLGTGFVEIGRLVSCFQSYEFEKIVNTSLALSTIFGRNDGSIMLSSIQSGSVYSMESHGGMLSAQRPHLSSFDLQTRYSILDPENIPNLLPVFIDTFTDHQKSYNPSVSKHSQIGYREPDNTFSMTPSKSSNTIVIDNSTTFEDSFDNLNLSQSVSTFQNNEQSYISDIDYVSKLDFLEFCQAAIDIKKYSIVAYKYQSQ